jgi:hypothetical protein
MSSLVSKVSICADSYTVHGAKADASGTIDTEHAFVNRYQHASARTTDQT